MFRIEIRESLLLNPSILDTSAVPTLDMNPITFIQGQQWVIWQQDTSIMHEEKWMIDNSIAFENYLNDEIFTNHFNRCHH